MHEPVNYKKKYKTMKKKLRFIVFEQECFLEELRKSQKRLLKVSRDRNFLMDRLLQYEKIDEQSSDSDATASTDSESEAVTVVPKKKKIQQPQTTSVPSQPSPSILSSVSYSSILTPQSTPGATAKVTTPSSLPPNVLKRKVVKKLPKGAKIVSPSSATAHAAVHMTREELERHLEMKQSTKPTFMSLEKTPNSLPDDFLMN